MQPHSRGRQEQGKQFEEAITVLGMEDLRSQNSVQFVVKLGIVLHSCSE